MQLTYRLDNDFLQDSLGQVGAVLDQQSHGFGVAVDGADGEQRRSVDGSIVLGVVDVPAALGRRERVQHVDDRLGVGRFGGDVKGRVAGSVLDLGVGQLELMNELASYVHVTDGDVQSSVSTGRLVALLIQQPEIQRSSICLS